MQQEIEAKFLNIDHALMREKLKTLGAKLEHPMRLMKRTLFDFPDRRFRDKKEIKKLRVRDEGDKVTVNYKGQSDNKYVYEAETTIGSYDKMIQIFEGVGLVAYSIQESKRESWRLGDVEVVLDEWPWVKSYIEIEGPNEAAIKAASESLGLRWDDAEFGSVDTVYIKEYPGIRDNETIGEMPEIRFGEPVPKWLEERR